ncbi:MAG: hypothetical protein KatS3mg029_0402 [Saprospiraceae bacterium]|nr:MAG: hypothetical protein KatS3mg029_0402 [Saprospiraceae bacterium]
MAAKPDTENKPIHYVDFDLLENVRLRISLKFLLALAGTIVAVTTTAVIGYHNIKKDLSKIDESVEVLHTEMSKSAEEQARAIRELEKQDIRMEEEIEMLRRRIEALEKKQN